MKIEKIENKIIKVIIEEKDYNLDEYYDNLIYLEREDILTFGDTNFRIFEKFFQENGYKPELLNLCIDDDKSIGLEMPATWYLNKGKHALSIAMYYNYLNFRGILEFKEMDTFNKKIVKDYGRTACIEVYLEKELKHFLDVNNISYFSTPKTLTECIRYLEGWDIEEYPRLKSYATFSKFIELWSRINFAQFNANEWYLGKKKSNEINKKGLTNVRLAVRYFWENYLLKNHKHINPEDVEIDILGGEKFSKIRKPKVVLISEDLFSKENSKFEIFKNLTRKMGKSKMYISKKKNDFPTKNAEIAKTIYPNSLIVLIENHTSLNKNFSLMNPIKYSINPDVVIATKVLKYAISQTL